MDKETVVYYYDTKTYLFSGNSVYCRVSGAIPSANPATFCLINLDFNKDPSVINFMTSNVVNTFPVLASSPNPSRYEIWVKQRRVVLKEYMPLWKRDELREG
jgi:hypothetical protein